VKRIDPAARRSAVLLTLLVLLVFVFAAWVARRDSLSDVDRGARSLIREGRPPALETPMRVVSILGSGDVLLPVTVLCSVVLWRRRHRALALWLPAIGLATGVTLALMKWVINKPRPTLRGYGFPSGHMFGATVFVLVVLYLLWTLETPRRWQRAARAAGLVFVTVVGYSRIYVNAHWLSDVIGGLFAGIAFALVTVLALDARLR
jgi:membrane-associated phospholipid phosphatase